VANGRNACHRRRKSIAPASICVDLGCLVDGDNLQASTPAKRAAALTDVVRCLACVAWRGLAAVGTVVSRHEPPIATTLRQA
jgi:hypothetical protein